MCPSIYLAFSASNDDNYPMEVQKPIPSSSHSDLSKKSDWRSFGLSLLFHALLIVLLAVVFTTTTGPGSQGEKIRSVEVVLTSVEESSEQFEYETQEQVDSNVTDSSQPESFEPPPSDQPPTLPDVSAPELPGFQVSPDSELDASQMTVAPSPANSAEKYELSQEDLKFIAREQAAIRRRAPRGDPANTQIFGTGNLSGRRFVFVIDRSKSMGDSGLGVLDKARHELTAALEALKPEHQFQVIAYHQSTIMIGKRQMLSASEENKLRVPTFIRSLVAFGATRHENGLSAGLAFRPDVLVFMTDGGLPILNNGQVEQMRKMAGGRTQIHSIQFGSGPNQDPDNFMLKLATETEGSFRYIDVNQWKD
jgi:hypothetical protein